MKTATSFRFKSRIALMISFLSLFFFSFNCYSQNWKELGSGSNALNPNNLFLSITTDNTGNVYAAGDFTDNNGYNYVAKWNGTNWSELGTGSNALNANSYISTIATDTIGNVYAAGYFTDSNGYYYVAKWDGTSWSELGSDSNALHANTIINTLITDKTGNLFAAGSFIDPAGHPYVAKWTGTKWIELGLDTNALAASAPIRSIAADKLGNIYAGGDFVDTGNKIYVAKWNGTSWSELGIGPTALIESDTTGQILSITIDANGNIYAAGTFTDTNGYYYVGKWNDVKWQELGSGSNILSADTVIGSNSGINSIATDASGNIYAAGYFKDAHGNPYVAKWNGSTWSELGSGFTNIFSVASYVWTIATDKIGNIFAAGNFTDSSGVLYVAEYTGTPGLVKTVQQVNNFIVYPNPLTDQLIIESSENGTVQLFDMIGHIVYRGKLDQTKLFINTNCFSKGTYLLQLSDDMGNSSVKEIVKQ